ncbi:MAG: hypothetical protein AAGC68_11555, partial [Verrucomicrobiota bacterium]
EPWTFGRTVMGRNLPEITTEFVECGVPLESLYPSFPIPAEAVNLNEVASEWRRGIQSAYEDFGIPCPTAGIDEIETRIQSSSEIDFAFLGEALQEKALITLFDKGIPVSFPLSPDLPAESVIQSARAKVLEEFSLAAYAEKLGTIYQTLAESPHGPVESARSDKVMSGFLHPTRFRPHFAQ